MSLDKKKIKPRIKIFAIKFDDVNDDIVFSAYHLKVAILEYFKNSRDKKDMDVKVSEFLAITNAQDAFVKEEKNGKEENKESRI